MISDADRKYISLMLGRPARGLISVAKYDKSRKPVVITTNPLIEKEKIPFPTFYYLINKDLIREISKLEANGFMNELNELLKTDEKLMNEYKKAHKNYITARGTILKVPQISNFSAGGMPERVKCIHALVAHELADHNPIGEIVIEKLKDSWSSKGILDIVS